MTLTNFPYDPLLDLAPWMGQRQASYRFDLVNRVSGIKQDELTPITGATLTHSTSQIIKRSLNLALGKEDTARINPIQDEVRPFMVFPEGQEYPLGEYIFTSASYQVFTSGELSNVMLNDKMYIVDQQIETVFTAKNPSGAGSYAQGSAVPHVLQRLLFDLAIRFKAEPSKFASTDSWSAGARRGSIIETLALIGDYFSPWFDNNGILQFIRAFNPATRIPDFDWDEGKQVMRAQIMRSSDILNAPNRFIVISNAPTDSQDPTFGVADVPVNAPHSIENRGFVIPVVTDLQALTKAQCAAIAANLSQRQTVFETTTLTTAPDPRHDGYNVIKWQGDLWLELAWTMTLTEGAPMTHTLRKAYR